MTLKPKEGKSHKSSAFKGKPSRAPKTSRLLGGGKLVSHPFYLPTFFRFATTWSTTRRRRHLEEEEEEEGERRSHAQRAADGGEMGEEGGGST